MVEGLVYRENRETYISPRSTNTYKYGESVKCGRRSVVLRSTCKTYNRTRQEISPRRRARSLNRFESRMRARARYIYMYFGISASYISLGLLPRRVMSFAQFHLSFIPFTLRTYDRTYDRTVTNCARLEVVSRKGGCISLRLLPCDRSGYTVCIGALRVVVFGDSSTGTDGFLPQMQISHAN